MGIRSKLYYYYYSEKLLHYKVLVTVIEEKNFMFPKCCISVHRKPLKMGVVL